MEKIARMSLVESYVFRVEVILKLSLNELNPSYLVQSYSPDLGFVWVLLVVCF